ncbi:transcriptional adapter 2-alpha-like isoform X2 [Oscarella lobularis]|uniref:transcriptional adapter 2-alpha-like isoform X2 n=1 Tax=Oscarella lobularis TaxID=121494 RepID=UPI0033140030
MDETNLCQSCSIYLQEPFIRCVSCPGIVDVCLQCFAKGSQFARHSNDHDYAVMTHAFPIGTDGNWTAREDVALLAAIEENGLGNWIEASQRVKTKSSEECRRHYYAAHFVESVAENSQASFREERHQFAVKRVSQDPPRPAFGTPQSIEMAGYMPWRGDFQIEYKDSAEQLLNEMKFTDEDTPLEIDVKLAIVDMYERILDERSVRKRIVRDHGLISWKNHRVYDMKQVSFGLELEAALKPFTRLHSPEAHERFTQGLIYEEILKNDITRLQQCRRNGLKTRSSIDFFEKMKMRRKSGSSRKRKAVNAAAAAAAAAAATPFNFLLDEDKDSKTRGFPMESKRLVVMPTATPGVFSRGKKPPSRLDISSLPGVERLIEEEQELCSLLRLQPLAYLQYKQTLVEECTKTGRVKLADARRIVRIDVNKTRALYDFFLQKGWIKT